MVTSTRPRVVVLGGGFGGLFAVRGLERSPVDIVLVDRSNHHLFQPLLYQVATAGLSAVEIAAPLRRILRRQRNVTVWLGECRSIDVATRRVQLADGAVDYDYLIVATGVRHDYFAHPEWEAHAPGLKTIEDALEMRRRILLAYERAERETDPARRRAWLTFVVVGGGATGVELAGALAELARHTLARDFRRIDSRAARVLLVEAADRILPGYPSDLSAAAALHLERLGVGVRTGCRVTRIDAAGVDLGTERLATRTVLWAAGVAASPIARSLGAPLDRSGKVRVERDLTLPGHREVQVIGDLAALEQDGRMVPGVAPAAIQEGRHAARNIERMLHGAGPTAFRYRDPGSMATIGRRAAVADLGRLRLSGFPAWIVWLVVHLRSLIGYRNRLVVLLEWAIAYFTFQRSARVILGGPLRAPGRQPEE